MAEGALLAWDTSTDNGVIAVGRGGVLVAERRFGVVRGHAGWLMPMIDRLMKEAGLGPADLGAVAVGTGPGGFTGVKVGVATAKAMALALGVPLVGITSLDLLAARAESGSFPLLASIDAKQGLLYAAGYSRGGPEPSRLTGYMCVTPGEAGEAAADLGGEVALAGHVPAALAEAAARAGGVVREVPPGAGDFPSGGSLIRLAASRLDAGDYGDAMTVNPLYLKKPV